MRGLIYGDYQGSVYEWIPLDKKNEVKKDKHITDDTVLAAGVADALLTCIDKGITDDEGIIQMVANKLRAYGRKYPEAGYSRSFQNWLNSSHPEPYNSNTNGAIMRCAAAGWLARSPEDARRLGKLTAMPTHNHPEALDAAAMTSEIIYRLKMGESIDKMFAMLNERYPIPRLDDIRPITEFDFTCKTTLPIAFAAFYEAAVKWGDFYKRSVVESAVSNAISLGGDTDTNAAIAGEFAEAWNYSWGYSEADGIYKGYDLWHESYANNWNYAEEECPGDILKVIMRMDAAVRNICPVRISNDFAYRTDDRGEAVIIRYPAGQEAYEKYQNESSMPLIVPEKLDGLPVTAIGSFAFHIPHKPIDCVIPDSVKMIGDYAFCRFKHVSLPDSLEVIGFGAFVYNNCVGRKLPDNLRILGARAFYEVAEAPVLPDRLEYIGDFAITKSDHVWPKEFWLKNECVIPRSVKRIGERALCWPDIFRVYKDSAGAAYCQKTDSRYYYLDPDLVSQERKREAEDNAEKIRKKEEMEKINAANAAKREEYDLEEVSIMRYAGWREHAEESGYIIDALDRVFKIVPKR